MDVELSEQQLAFNVGRCKVGDPTVLLNQEGIYLECPCEVSSCRAREPLSRASDTFCVRFFISSSTLSLATSLGSIWMWAMAARFSVRSSRVTFTSQERPDGELSPESGVLELVVRLQLRGLDVLLKPISDLLGLVRDVRAEGGILHSLNRSEELTPTTPTFSLILPIAKPMQGFPLSSTPTVNWALFLYPSVCGDGLTSSKGQHSFDLQQINVKFSPYPETPTHFGT